MYHRRTPYRLVFSVEDLIICVFLHQDSIAMAFSASGCTGTLSKNPFSSLSPVPRTLGRNPTRLLSIKAVKATEPEANNNNTEKASSSSNAQPSTATAASKPPPKKKPVYSSEHCVLQI